MNFIAYNNYEENAELLFQNYKKQIQKVLDKEDYVPVPPQARSDPYYTITYLIKDEVRKHKWIEGEKGRKMTWDEARDEWLTKYHEDFIDFIIQMKKV